MPEKDIITAAWAGLTGLSAATKGAVMATIIAVLRVMYDGKETDKARMLLEALICGSLSLCATSVIGWLNMPADMSIAAGGAVGFLGVQTMRDFMMRWFGRQVD